MAMNGRFTAIPYVIIKAATTGGFHRTNNGPHAIDQSLQLFGDYEYTLLADLRNVLTSGDAEDFIKIVLKPDAA